MRIKHVTLTCQTVSSERGKRKKKHGRPTLIIRLSFKNVAVMSVLTKISHNFHCHFNAPTLCGGLQSQGWRQRVGGGRRTSGHRSIEGIFGAGLVCQSLSIPLTMHTLWWAPSPQTKSALCILHTLCRRIMKPSKCGCQKGVWLEKLPTSLQLDVEDRRVYC